MAAVKALNIDKLKGHVRNRLYRVGLEMEGGWTNLSPNVNLENDTSVQIPNPGSPTWRTGELVSEPLEPIQVGPWMRRWYPTNVNQTCGMHVHVSFRDANHYARLADSEAYQATVINEFKKWATLEGFPASHHIWSRLTGKNQYCLHKFWPKLQMMPTKKDYDHSREGCRYTAINYCFGVNKTLECRLLPMMDTKEQGVRAVKEFLSITNACLVALRGKEEKLVGMVPVGKSYIQSTEETFG